MKRMLFALGCALFSLSAVAQTLSDKQIADVIMMSKEANMANGIKDPNKIYVGQKLTFLFADGQEHSIIVEKGDSQWKILETKIAALVQDHGQVVPFKEPPVVEKTPEQQQVTPPLLTENTTPWYATTWFLILMGIIALAAILILANNLYTKRDPGTSGRPVQPGGVSAANASEYMQQFYPGLTIRNITKGRLSGKNMLISYAGNPSGQRRTFKNEPAFRGTITRNNQEEFIYFLEICGNRARQGNFFTGNDVTFVADVEQPASLQAATTPTVQPATTAATATTDLSTIISAITEPLKDKDNGKLKVEMAEVKIEMEFSSAPEFGLFLQGFSLKEKNGQAKDGVKETSQS